MGAEPRRIDHREISQKPVAIVVICVFGDQGAGCRVNFNGGLSINHVL
jgi:hypothetical protein